jgi:hypothetical protein
MSASAETVIVARTPTRESRRTTRPTAPRPAPARPRRHTRRAVAPTPAPMVRRPKRARTGVFAVLVVMILTIGLLSMLWINTTLAQGAFVLTDLQKQRAQLLETEQQLAEQLARAEAPAQVEVAARALGMVPQSVPVFVRLEDGQIIGDPIPQPQPVPLIERIGEPVDVFPVDAPAVDVSVGDVAEGEAADTWAGDEPVEVTP